MLNIVKKNGLTEEFDRNKIKSAIMKSADRVMERLSIAEQERVCDIVESTIHEEMIEVAKLHILVENALDEVNSQVAKSYREYRNYKTNFIAMLDSVYKKIRSIDFIGDRDNANTDSTLTSTKRCLGWTALNEEFYKKFFLTPAENEAIKDGYIYIHDKGSRLDSANCQLFDLANVLKGGFELGNIRYSEPTTLAICFNVISDVILSAAAQNYGGFTICEIDKILAPYAEKSYHKYVEEYMEIINEHVDTFGYHEYETIFAHDYAMKKVRRDFEQGFQALEYKFNTISSSRGDYPFITFTFGLGEKEFEIMGSESLLKVRQNGQGVEGFKKPVLFPKLVFLYDEQKHGQDKILESLFDKAVECSSKAQYPDYLSMSGEGYVASMYKQYGEVISPMGALAGHEHLYVKINNSNPIDISIKDLFNYIKTNKAIVGRPSQLHFPLNRLNIKGIGKHNYQDFRDKCLNKSGVYRITYIPEDVSYIGSSSNIQQRWREHRKVIRCTGGVDGALCFADTNVANYLFEIIEYCDNFKERELFYISNEPNVNLRGCSKSFYKNHYITKDTGYDKPIFKHVKLVPQDLIDVSHLDIKVYDINNKWTKIRHVFKNDKTNTPLMMEISYLENGKRRAIYCTEDHPLWTGVKFTRTDCLRLTDSLYRADGLEMPIISIKWLSKAVDSYDIGTETGTFIGSDIQMHNCRAFLSPYWEKGGQEKLNDSDKPIFVGRWNAGAISVNLPMIYMKAKTENKDFYEIFTYYLEMIRNIHIRTRAYLAKMKASKNPLGYMQGGFYKGYLKANDCIEPLLDYVTFSFGYTALNELQQLHNHKSLVEDGQFALEVMQYLNNYIARIKKEDHILYAIYGTPGESMISLQVEQFRKKYGIIEKVSDKDYFTNSFHCHVSENISPIEKQDLEKRFWELSNGGKITYTRYPIDYNLKAIKDIIRRGMGYGFYQGVNMDKCYCEKCGYEQLSMEVCPVCGSIDITQVNRVCGYLGYTKVNGRSFINDGKLAEIKDRISM